MLQTQVPAKTRRRSNLARKRSSADSARTSFLLSPEALEAMDWLVERLGSPKEIFETALRKGLLYLVVPDWLEGEAESRSKVHIPDMPLPENSTRKSFVIESSTLKALNTHARRKKIKRDVLVNHLILSYKKRTEENHKRLFEKHKKAEALISDYITSGLTLEEELRVLLGEDDPIAHYFGNFMILLGDFGGDVTTGLKDGKPMTDDDLSHFQHRL